MKIEEAITYAIAKEDKCSFTIIDQDEIHPDEYTSYFRSVIAFGRIHRLESMEYDKTAGHGLICRFS